MSDKEIKQKIKKKIEKKIEELDTKYFKAVEENKYIDLKELFKEAILFGQSLLAKAILEKSFVYELGQGATVNTVDVDDILEVLKDRGVKL